MKINSQKAALALESGKIFFGQSFGFNGERTGEIVFNTSMTGYQEILTDPSYKGQIIVMTEPHIGNVGVNKEDVESLQIFAEGLVVRENSSIFSNWRSEKSLQDFLVTNKIPAISDVDTRALTKHIRDIGTMRAIISTKDFNPKSLIKKVKRSDLMSGKDLAKEVTCKKPYQWVSDKNEWKWKDKSSDLKSKDINSQSAIRNPQLLKVVVMDFGAKQNILRCLAERNCKVTVVPAKTSAQNILSLNPDGILLSNGPGDPAAVTYAIETIKELIRLPLTGLSVRRNTYRLSIPMFGICLGHQLLGLALGGKTFKLKFGHRGANHPVKNLETGKIEITTQNHGFCVDIDSLSNENIEITHLNLNDNTMEGMKHKELPIFAVQYHPESSAGTHDSRYLFDQFINIMQERKK